MPKWRTGCRTLAPKRRQSFHERGLHTTKPAYEELLVDDNNRVWLELSATQDFHRRGVDRTGYGFPRGW